MLPQSIPGKAVMADNVNSANTSAKATLRRVAEQLLTLANRGGLYFCFFLASTVHFVGTLSFCVRVHFIRQV